ncbi:Fe-S-containing protein [Patescibacteria group bacterium]
MQIKVELNKLVIFVPLILIVAGVVIGLFQRKTEPVKENALASDPSLVRPAVLSEKENGFLGEKGEVVEAVEGLVYLDEAKVNDGNLHSFNYYSPQEDKTIYFFVIKASDGTYRVAANACEVCFDSQEGFNQVGDLIRCENCRTTYSKDEIALQRGGCNPRPIDSDALVESGQVIVKVDDIQKAADLF